MIISKINPHGFCGGVINALSKAHKAVDNVNTKKPIYMIGKIIHNDIVCNDLISKGIIIKNSNKYDAIKEIDFGTVIFSAHGIDSKLIDEATSKGLDVIDTTCSKVNIVKKNISKHIDTRTILYIGVKNHPECDAILSISKDIILISDVNDLVSLDNTKSYYITNQTTLSLFKIKDLYEYVEVNFSDVIVDNKICLATTTRQQAIIDTIADCIIVVGDKNSSNTNELFNIASSKCDSILISCFNELDKKDFSMYNDIKVTSGASTPEYLVDEVIDFLEKNYL